MLFKLANSSFGPRSYNYASGLNIITDPYHKNYYELPTTIHDESNLISGLKLNARDDVYHVWTVRLPTEEEYPGFKLEERTERDFLKANAYVLIKEYDLRNLDTFLYLRSVGVDLFDKENSALVYAIEASNCDLIRYLIDSYPNKSYLDDEIYGKIINLTKQVGFNIFFRVTKIFIEDGADLNRLLSLALKEGKDIWIGIIKYLIEEGATGHLEDERYFLRALESGSYEMVVFLHESGCVIPNLTYESDVPTPLIDLASSYGSHKIFHYLTVNMPREKLNIVEAFHLATLYDAIDTVKYIIDNALVPNDIFDFEQAQDLMFSSNRRNRTPMVKYLFDMGFGDSFMEAGCLKGAVSNCFHEILRIILVNGFNPKEINDESIEDCIREGTSQTLPTLKCINEFESSLLLKQRFLNTAISKGSGNVIRFLMDLGVEFDQDFFPVMCSTCRYELSIISYVADRIVIRDYNMQSALRNIISFDDVEVFNYLVERNLNVIDHSKLIGFARTSILKRYIEMGFSIENVTDKTFISYCRTSKIEMVKLLVEKGLEEGRVFPIEEGIENSDCGFERNPIIEYLNSKKN